MGDVNRTFGTTRRGAMAGAAAAGVAAGLAPTVLGGRAARASEPKGGGIMRVASGHGSTTDSTDPATWEHGYVTMLGMALHNYLTMIDVNNELVPELAEEWSSNADASIWTFKIRSGVEYHNGRTTTAEDAKAVLDYHRAPNSTSAAAGILTSIAETRAEGDKLVVEMKGPNADFPILMSDYHLPITPMLEDGKPDGSGMGSGCYVLQEFEPGIRAHLTRNPNSWRDDEGWVEEAELLVIADPAARQNALLSGQVDVIDRVDPKVAHLIESNPGFVVESVPSTIHYSMPMITTTAPFDDNNIRLALKHAVNREDIVDKILRGHGSPGNDSPITPANRFYNPDLAPLEYDPDKARHYLKQAGLDSLLVDLSTSDAAFVGAVDMAVLYKEHAAAAGIEINVIRESPDGYWSDVWMNKPWSTCYWDGRPTEDWMFSTTYAADAPWNDTFWNHERFNELLVQARGELDEGLRREMYYEMQQIIREEGGVVIPMFANSVDARSTRISHGPKLSSYKQLDGCRVIQRWWIDESAT